MSNVNWVATAPISTPLAVNLDPDVDLNGMKFSYTHGIFYSPVSEHISLQLPPVLDATEQSRQFRS